jgi:hypothetical protein
MTEVVIVIPQRWTPSVEWKLWGKHTRCRSAGMLPRTWSCSVGLQVGSAACAIER